MSLALGEPLVRAVLEDDEDVVEMLLDRGADANARATGEEGAPSLAYVAARENYADILRILLKHGADPGPRQPSSAGDGSALYGALINGSEDALDVLLEYGVDVNTRMTSDEWTPVYLLTIRGGPRGDMALTLINHDADVNIATKKGMLPAHQALKTGNTNWFGFLLEQGADAHALDSDGASLAVLAVKLWNMSALRALVAGLGVDGKRRALKIARRIKNEPAIRLLLANA